MKKISDYYGQWVWTTSRSELVTLANLIEAGDDKAEGICIKDATFQDPKRVSAPRLTLEDVLQEIGRRFWEEDNKERESFKAVYGDIMDLWAKSHSPELARSFARKCELVAPEFRANEYRLDSAIEFLLAVKAGLRCGPIHPWED